MFSWRAWCSLLLLAGSLVARADDSPFRFREVTVAASPDVAEQVPVPQGQKVVDFDVWSTGAEAAVLLRDGGGNSGVWGWKVAPRSFATLFTLPAGFEARAIATHPAERTLFVSGRSAGQSVIYSARFEGSAWKVVPIFRSALELRRLLVAPRPFEIGYDEKAERSLTAYRLVFGGRLADGSYSTRSITVDGKREYQIIGPQAGYVSVPGDEQPARLLAKSALPAAFHPEGNILLWQDAGGCYQQLAYDMLNWGKTTALPGVPCGVSLTATPNGAGLLLWKRGEAGVALLLGPARARSQQAAQYTFAATPSSVPDGKGIIGLVEAAGGSQLVYVPIAVPMPDVVNAWMFVEHAGDADLFLKNSGLFRSSKSDQIFQLYESENYACGGWDHSTPTRPYFVTTDILWEIVAAAYEGTFIVQERQQAVPAFREFTQAAGQALSAKSPASPWAQAFAAVNALQTNRLPGNEEAGRIARASGRAVSAVFGGEFDYSELKPRGHYTASPEMANYFKAVHFLTQLAQTAGRDPGELAALPEEVRAKAMRWIAVYEPYIAPSRGELVWGARPGSPPEYMRHRAENRMVFPLSWGFDNEVLLATVYHSNWPEAEQITGAKGARLLPSGLDLAAVLGSGLAHALLKSDLRDYPALGATLDALSARRPKGTPANLYDRWIAALAVQWAEEVRFPGDTAQATATWKSKRLQTGLASWATLRHATVLVNERSDAECGEGGFEAILLRAPRGYVEPDPKTFSAIAELFDAMAKNVSAAAAFEKGVLKGDEEEPVRQGILRRLGEAAEKARLFAKIAEKELRGQELTDKEYEEILAVGRVAEHQFLVFKSLASKDYALSTPDPMMKIADVAGGGGAGALLEAAVGRPLEWDQIVPFFGRRLIVKGSVYSYYELTAPAPLNDDEWRARSDREPHPAWVATLISGKELSCPAKAPF